jgi:mevalonate kinase
MRAKPYTAKILLFGEYGIIKDAMGLSIPYDFYRGALVYKDSDMPVDKKKEAECSAAALREYCRWIEENRDNLTAGIDTAAMMKDIDEGLYFDSSIPLGYGVGSSGAVVAAVYDRYGINVIKADGVSSQDIIRLKGILGELEGYFHGKSSGLDPLICYLNLPILIRSTGEIDMVGIPSQNADGRGAIFLLDTGMKHSTGALIDVFFEKMKNEGFRRMIREEFTALSDACIDAFLSSRSASLMENVKKLSRVVYEHFSPMIPTTMKKLWKKGIETDTYYLKLCGAGGGGFMLGFTDDYQKTSAMLKSYNIQPIYRF